MEVMTLTLLLNLLESKDFRQLKEKLSQMNEVDVALLLEELPQSEQVVRVFRTLPKEMAADVFAELSYEMQEYLVGAITDQELSTIIEDLFVDDAVDLIEELPANVVKRVLSSANPDTRALINQFLKYPENSAGSIMTSEYVDLKKSMTVGEALGHIRRTGIDKETVYTCYVTAPNRVLEGVVSVRTLLISQDEQLVEELMEEEPICANTGDDREMVVQLFAKYGWISVPIVDHENRLVGIVTVDDAVDVMEQEATEDIEKMAALTPSEKPYLKTSVFELAKNRILWLLVLMVSAMVTGSVLGKYEHAFATLPLLVTFIPMLTDTGGNAGSQSATLIIRGMTLGEIQTKDAMKVLWKELRVSLMVGAVLGLVNFIRLLIMYPGNELIALTVVISLFATVIIAKTVGGLLPMAAKFIKADPAIMASPLITTIVDAFALIIYFSVAQRLLNI